MTAALFPWFLLMLLVGVVIGLVVSIVIASTLVRGHYTHFINHTQPLSPPYDNYSGGDAARRQYPRPHM